ncbi:SDR family NAD(P)-dependent oxidoreductase [Breznakiella homolactica]|uniref:SDR family NAD(P)-dependent oxidoreductase n=1 Tax=Breznakiella homolactica TaxID=2798577 RepID=A0A7T7XNP4_9SPIR|nr:SDR family NAD(P)-dependent oxidoreductase [Breznakiella homolactica]QQO09676.1 SDR family NAD(P)-dependent oxidoreductase [Breznakiella homolactica]
MEQCFSGRNALVIGGSGGIGAAVSVLLGEAGARVWVHGGNSRERLGRTVTAIRDKGGTAEGLLLALDKPEAVREIFDRVPPPDILVCAWGPFKRGSLGAMAPEDWTSLVYGNLAIPGILVSWVIGKMMETGWGRILLFGGTGTAAVRGFTSTAAYSSAKTALGVLAQSAARQAGSRGVTCNVLCPGLVDTEYLNAEARAYNREHSPGNSPMIPEDVAKTALTVLGNPRLNGAVIPFDGGIVL